MINEMSGEGARCLLQSRVEHIFRNRLVRATQLIFIWARIDLIFGPLRRLTRSRALDSTDCAVICHADLFSRILVHRRLIALIIIIFVEGDSSIVAMSFLPLLDRVDLVLVFVVGGRAEDWLDVKLLSQFSPVDTLANHDTASFIIGASVLYHVGALVDAAVAVDLQVHDE